MGRTERLFRITSLLREVKKIRFTEMLDRLDVSPATLKRDLKYLRENLGTPIHYDAFERAYQMDTTGHKGKREIPGFWFDESELLALAFACRLLEELDPDQQLAPRLRLVIERLTASLPKDAWHGDWMDRIRLFMPGRREVSSQIFDAVSAAVLQRRRMRIRYFTRSRDVRSDREISPQRLIFQKAWYVDAHCHKVDALRRFSLDAIESASVLDACAFEIDLDRLGQMFDGTYGAFAGEPTRWATLLFSSVAARWVGQETWHPLQRSRPMADGRLELLIPYRETTELVMDVLRHGDQVEVVGDDDLVRAIRERVRALSRRYDR
jgi:predicted DNA-binding transcriptional regulator YafY